VIFHIIWKNKIILNMEEPLFMFQLIIAVDVSEHRSIYNKLNARARATLSISLSFASPINVKKV